MPRIHQYSDQYAMRDLIAEINAKCARMGCRSQKAFGEIIGVCQSTVGNYLKKPDNIPLGILRIMVKQLHLDPVVVLLAVGYTAKDIKKLREK
ncbi:MAG: helix-turn-helix transcriptional regulator [Oscillospiraceae bacterium]|nr:helix-turn-helix transcriptional regulator [Oscillospiraceae bacterium]